jgi:tRNA 2-thiouridine synthesizing protein C
MNHNIICIKQSATHDEQHDYECLDLVMTLASLDYHIYLVFYGDGVCSLFDTNPNSTYSKQLQALPLFDVNDIWVDETSLNTRQLNALQLPNNMKPLTSAELKQLLNNSLAVYTL